MAPNTKSKLPIKCVYLGIDLGTTTSRVALWSIVAEAVQGMFEIPSYVAFTDTGLLIGDAAKNQLHKNASNTVFDVKWLIGRKFSDASVQHYKRLCPFQITEGLDDKLLILVSHCGLHKQLTLEEILAMLLVEVRQMAEDPTGSVVTHAIVTVPAYFNESQQQATKDAGTISGFEVIRILNDPTAAAIKYAFDSQPTAKKKVFVLDFGGGFLDVSLIEISSTGIKVQATAGDLLLGGRDFDYVLVDHCVKILETERGMHVSGDPKALSMLWTACERAKINLSISDHTVIDVKALPGNTDVELDITRAVFQELNEDFSRKCSVLVQNCLEDADVVMSSVDDVMLLGGSVRMSWVEQYLRNYFERKNFWSFSQPEQVVACGAALKIGFMKRELKVSEVIPRSTCFQNSNTYNLIIVQKQTPPFL